MSAWRERARQAEGMGYSAIYLTDHFHAQFGPLVAATVAAEATTNLHVGTLVLNNGLRNPVVLAKEVATLGLAAEGRVELGLGAGWLPSDFAEAGMAYERPAARVGRLSESLTVLRSLLADGEASFTGKYYQVCGARCDPRPVSPPRLLVGGGSRGVLTVAATQADIVNVSLASAEKDEDLAARATVEHFDRCVNWVRAAAGDRFDSLELQLTASALNLVGSRRAALRVVTMLGFPGEAALEVPSVLVGTEDELCERLVERRHRWGFSNIVVPGELMETFAPVVARLAGQ